jgi:prepilin-type N-terminal cleavage/methylation domain-containing protein
MIRVRLLESTTGLPPSQGRASRRACPGGPDGGDKPRRSLADRRRRAFTLLEVLLAAAIGVLLLAALYVAVDIQFRQTQTGRDIVEQGTLARGLINRIVADIAPGLGPPNPSRYQQSSSQGSGGGSPSGGSSSAGGGASSSGSPAGSQGTSGSGSSGSSSGSSSNSNTSGNYTFTVQGDSSTLTLYISRVPREVLVPPQQAAAATDLPITSDLRRITYWLSGSSGLARQELQLVTSDDAATTPPDDPQYVIAPEVTGLTFSYWDGSTWQDSWDGTTTGSDGVTPIGPPMAIAVTIELLPPGAGPGAKAKTYRQVIPIITANGATQQNTGSSQSGTGQPGTGGS